MSSSYVCQTCRRELHRRLARRTAVQLLPRATFISFGDIVPPKKEGGLGREDGTADQDTKRPPKDRPEPPRGAGDGKRDAAPGAMLFGPGRYSRRKNQTSNEDLKDLQQLFGGATTTRARIRGIDALSPPEAASLIPTPNDAEDLVEEPTPLDPKTIAQEDTAAVKLYKLLSKPDHDATEAWDVFKELYAEPGKDGDNLRRPTEMDKNIIRIQHLFRLLLRSLCSNWHPGHEILPAPATLVATMYELGIMGQGWYLLEILELQFRTIRLNTEENEMQDSAARIELEYQVLSLWAQFIRNCSKKRMKKIADDEVTAFWQGMPDAGNFSKADLGAEASGSSIRFRALFDGVQSGSTQHLSAAAALTYDYFSHKYGQDHVEIPENIDYKPFLNLMVRIWHGAKDFDIIASLATTLLKDNGVPGAEIETVARRLQLTQQRAALAFAIDDPDVAGKEVVSLSDEQVQKLTDYFFIRIKRQIETQNRGVLDQLWEQAQLAFNYKPSDGSSEATSHTLIPLDIYSAFLLGYRDLGEPQIQAQIWNHMYNNGVTPTTKQWGLLLSAHQRHLASFEEIWERMSESYTMPDHHAWCTRLSAHAYYGNPEDAIGFLYQWAEVWLAEAKTLYAEQNVTFPELISNVKTDGRTHPRPTTDALTTVVTALVQRKGRDGSRRRRVDLVPDALAWAATFGIKPNLWCYNTLFRTCLKDGNLKEGMQVLAKMEEDGITPDEYTFYGFADFIFRQGNRTTMTKDEQFSLMGSVLELLESRGMNPNAVFFGSMIDGLLKREEPNIVAAMMLLRLLLAKRVKVTSQIWTSLMTHHFTGGQSPSPDRRRPTDYAQANLGAVEALWRTMNSYTGPNKLSLDSIFYDRMIEGFSKAGQPTRAMTFLERMVKEGKRPGWRAMTDLLQALSDAGMDTRAQSLVDDVVAGRGIASGGLQNSASLNEGRWSRPQVNQKEGFFALAEGWGYLRASEAQKALWRSKASKGKPRGLAEGGEGEVESEVEADVQWGPEGESEVGEKRKSVEQLEKEYQDPGLAFQNQGWDDVVTGASSASARRKAKAWASAAGESVF